MKKWLESRRGGSALGLHGATGESGTDSGGTMSAVKGGHGARDAGIYVCPAAVMGGPYRGTLFMVVDLLEKKCVRSWGSFRERRGVF